MTPEIHGTKRRRGTHHPVFDLRHWSSVFPFRASQRNYWGSIATPADLARAEQARILAAQRGSLGPSVPADVFVWADTTLRDRPWLTRIGGIPWRSAQKPWPRWTDGTPLVFLGQICFLDSLDIAPRGLPGAVLLFFGQYKPGWVYVGTPTLVEWSPAQIKRPASSIEVPPLSELPFQYQGVIHRTTQYVSWRKADPPFQAAGFADGSIGPGSIQANSIGRHASLPQGWPFVSGDGNRLICTLSSLYLRGRWPLCDMPVTPQRMTTGGFKIEISNTKAMDFGIGDDGAIWVYRNRRGSYKSGSACG